MYQILQRQDLVPNIHQYRIAAPKIAEKAQPGQFIIVRVDEVGERIPLTIADWNRDEGSISVVFNEVGRTTHKMALLQQGDSILNVVGPLGIPTEIENYGTVVCVAAGYGIAAMAAIARALKEAGNTVISIVRAPSKETLFGDERLGSFSDQITVVTGDGSYGVECFVLEPLKDVLDRDEIDRVLTIGPACVMRLVALTTRPFEVKTMAHLNPIMVDGTGMCGCCRVMVGEKTRFACVDGPEFDAHEVDWTWLLARRCTYSGADTPMLQYQCRFCAQW